MEEVDKYAKIIWDYQCMNQTLIPADIILVLGSRDLLPAYRACDLFFQQYAPVIIFSGDFNGKERILAKPEAEMYRDIALKEGVLESAIFVENKSCNTGENVVFSKELILKEKIPHERIIIITKPYAEKRAFATFKKNWPEPDVLTTSPLVSFDEYINHNKYDTKDHVINRMVGDLQRMKEYPKLGFQIEQEISEEAWDAAQKLILLGYNKSLIK
jgi:uncharacterized SAM-binding protein YcdF (DUF218 family)